MQSQLLRRQQALRAGIQRSDARARQYSEEIVLGVMRQYDLILGFLQQIKPTLAEYPELNMFYYPVESKQLLCVYRTADLPQPVPLEFRSYLLNTRLKAKDLFFRQQK